MKKITFYSELVYIVAMLTLPLSVSMSAAADFGVSMIVAPAYIMSLKFDIFTFGQWDYILQGVLFIGLCVALKKIKPIYFVSFLTCFIYGTVLDLWRTAIPVLNPDITPPGSMDMHIRIIFFALSMFLTAFAVALFFRTYIYPQVCDFFVVGITKHFGVDRTKLKRIFDTCCLGLSVVLTLLFFGAFRGIGVGTILVTALNGLLIGGCGKFIERIFDIKPYFVKLSEKFEF